jgi:sulfur-carrier protein adenylyltransferase/sulfurtransferase
MLSSSDKEKYSRQISVPGFGIQGQEKLKNSSVLVIGAGGLGCPALLYLASCGVGSITIADHDTIALSNLPRQILFGHNDIGKSKAIVAGEKLKLLHPESNVTAIAEQITSENADTLIANHDVILDCTDNFETRYLINDACLKADKVLVSASLYRFQAQVYVINFLLPDGKRSADYRTLFPNANLSDAQVDCNAAGVIGSLAGMAGTIQATEAIKIISGSGDVLANKILFINAEDWSVRTFTV